MYNNTRNYQKLKLSPFSLEAELFFNASYFLDNEHYSTSPSSSEEEMHIERRPVPITVPIVRSSPVTRSINQQYQNQHQPQLLQRHQPKPINLPAPISRAATTSITRSINHQHADLITKAANNHNAILLNVNIGNNNPYSPYASKITAQQSENMLAEEYEKLVDSFNQVHEKEKETQQFKLPSSKSPIMEALVYCSINKYGIELKELNTTSNKILFYVNNFHAYYKHSCSICSKQSPSEDIRARMKALQRWFVTFPAWRELEYPFELLVKPSHYNKMHEIISKMVRFYENVDTDPITG